MVYASALTLYRKIQFVSIIRQSNIWFGASILENSDYSMSACQEIRNQQGLCIQICFTPLKIILNIWQFRSSDSLSEAYCLWYLVLFMANLLTWKKTHKQKIRLRPHRASVFCQCFKNIRNGWIIHSLNVNSAPLWQFNRYVLAYVNSGVLSNGFVFESKRDFKRMPWMLNNCTIRKWDLRVSIRIVNNRLYLQEFTCVAVRSPTKHIFLLNYKNLSTRWTAIELLMEWKYVRFLVVDIKRIKKRIKKNFQTSFRKTVGKWIDSKSVSDFLLVIFKNFVLHQVLSSDWLFFAGYLYNFLFF